METIICPACKGLKKLWGNGMISQTDCELCKGIGWTRNDQCEDSIENVEEDVKLNKKRGRPKVSHDKD